MFLHVQDCARSGHASRTRNQPMAAGVNVTSNRIGALPSAGAWGKVTDIRPGGSPGFSALAR